eukprot:gene20197-12604_t
MASKSYLSPLLNVVESIRRTGGKDALATLSVVALDAELVNILPSSLETVSHGDLSKELGMCDAARTRKCGGSLDPNRMANAATSNSSVNLRTRAYQDLWSFRI